MPSRDIPGMPSRRRGPVFYLFALLFSVVLFIFVYRRFSSPGLGSSFEIPPESGPSRPFSIELHPKDHIRRLPTSLSHHWNITKGIRAPDGVNKSVYLINGTLERLLDHVT